jgi:putative methionine-R-sulfoxide reductase with GAF domain
MSHSGALEAIDRILNRSGEAQDVLRAIVDVLHDRFDHYSWVGIYLVVGEIDIDSDRPAAFDDDDRSFLERVALLISPACSAPTSTRISR